MSNFTYFLPKAKSVEQTPDELKKVFDNNFDGVGIRGTSNGPNGGDGLYLNPPLNEKCTHWLDSGTYWVGWNTLPTAQDLERNIMMTGERVKLADQEWIIPIVHAPYSTLPRGFRYLAGKFNTQIISLYDDLVAAGANWYDLSITTGFKGTHYEDFFKFNVQCLQINYKIGPTEAGFDCLNLLNTESCVPITMAAIGIPEMTRQYQAQKKTLAQLDISNMNAGEQV